ncbi:MAG TPA: hypothetical protein VFK05_21605 [Polyangiaceae bacterium]|nr:hypothetical protein [Polyangiaceae bacterium]
MADATAPPILFLATPTHDARVHHAYMNGVLEAALAHRGRLIISKFTSLTLSMSRDILTAHFLRSSATHLLWVDSDIGWGAADLDKLLSANKDFVCGNYARKQEDRALASELRNRREGKLIEAKYAAAGFVLLTRACVQRLVEAHPELKYETPHGPAWALWSPIFQRVPRSEDISFSKRWQDLGERIWVHSEVILKHYGETIYLPRSGDPDP